jgi:hypothetical protein
MGFQGTTTGMWQQVIVLYPTLRYIRGHAKEMIDQSKAEPSRKTVAGGARRSARHEPSCRLGDTYPRAHLTVGSKGQGELDAECS